MSHQPQRTEKDCLNCGAIVAGRYCGECGQENIVTHQGFGHMLQHFIFDLFHFDGKFFDTVKPLLFRPGFVPRAFINGQRVTFLDPIRMYLFTSAVFFIAFSAMGKKGFFTSYDSDPPLSKKQRFAVASRVVAGDYGADAAKQLPLLLDTTKIVYMRRDSVKTIDDSALIRNGESFHLGSEPFENKKRTELGFGNNWFGRLVSRRMERLNERFMEDHDEAQAAFNEDFLHRMPMLLFVSLPFFALLLKLLYVRKRRFFYADHLIFTLYHYVFSFLVLLMALSVGRIHHYLPWRPFKWVVALLLLSTFVSLFSGMRRFYQQGIGKTIIKFLLLNVLGTIMIIILFLVFLLISAIQF